MNIMRMMAIGAHRISDLGLDHTAGACGRGVLPRRVGPFDVQDAMVAGGTATGEICAVRSGQHHHDPCRFAG